MNKDNNNDKIISRFLFLLTVAAILACAALIVFTFITVDELGLWQCLMIAVMVIGLVALTAITVRKGLKAYGRQ